MSEYPINISNLNDFIFCPASIYFHFLEDEDNLLFQNEEQLNGTKSHEKSDLAVYSQKKTILQGMAVYSSEYNLFGKIDVFDVEKGILTERKKMLKTIYDGYVFQLYAQYFSLLEMGYNVKIIRFYSMDDNKVYNILKPEDDALMYGKFIQLINDINNFSFVDFKQYNKSKCEKCIYEPLCSFSVLKGE